MHQRVLLLLKPNLQTIAMRLCPNYQHFYAKYIDLIERGLIPNSQKSLCPTLPNIYKSIFIGQQNLFYMPRITKSVAKDHRLNAVKKHAELTTQEVGVIITNNEGNFTAIGRQSFQDYVQERRREIVRTMIRASSSSVTDPLIETPCMLEDSVTSDPVTDLSTRQNEYGVY